MNTIKNANGNTYYIEASFEANGSNVLLLSYYGEQETGIIQKYIVARDWNEKYSCWGSAKYFDIFNGDFAGALESAKECFKDNVDRILYSLF